MNSPVLDSFCSNLQVVDSYYHSIMHEVCFQHISACKLLFHTLHGYGKNVKNHFQTLLLIYAWY